MREGDLLKNEIARHALGPLSCRDDGTHAGGIVDEFEEVGFLRRVCVVNDKPRGDFPPVGVEDVACVRTADAPPPRDHLPTVAVVTEQFDNAFHRSPPNGRPWLGQHGGGDQIPLVPLDSSLCLLRHVVREHADSLPELVRRGLGSFDTVRLRGSKQFFPIHSSLS